MYTFFKIRVCLIYLLPFNSTDPSLTALANEVEALRAALLQKEQQVQSLTRPIPHLTNSLYPPFTTSGLATTPGLITTQTHVPGVAPVVSAGVLNGAASARTVPVMSPMVTSSGGLGTNGYLASPGQVHHHHYHSKKTSRGTHSTINLFLPYKDVMTDANAAITLLEKRPENVFVWGGGGIRTHHLCVTSAMFSQLHGYSVPLK